MTDRAERAIGKLIEAVKEIYKAGGDGCWVTGSDTLAQAEAILREPEPPLPTGAPVAVPDGNDRGGGPGWCPARAEFHGVDRRCLRHADHVGNHLFHSSAAAVELSPDDDRVFYNSQPESAPSPAVSEERCECGHERELHDPTDGCTYGGDASPALELPSCDCDEFVPSSPTRGDVPHGSTGDVLPRVRDAIQAWSRGLLDTGEPLVRLLADVQVELGRAEERVQALETREHEEIAKAFLGGYEEGSAAEILRGPLVNKAPPTFEQAFARYLASRPRGDKGDAE